MSEGASIWLVPLRECVCFAAWAGGLFGNTIQWGAETFTIKAFRELMRASDAAPMARTTGEADAAASTPAALR